MSGAPRRLGVYRILGRIADGANARVKLGEHTLTGARVALKFISRSWINDNGIRSQVSREIQYLRLLSHPHIIKLYEVIITNTDIVLVLEYAQDELFNIIEKGGRMNETTARIYFQQIMYALAYSHSLQVVHRDLKPENILLGEDAAQQNGLKVKIADFGLSNEWSDGDWLKTGCGTPHYAAPEIISGNLYGLEVDVWSCGAILYVMVCGRLPYDDDNMAVLFQRIAHADYQFPEDLNLSQELRSLIEGMMTVDPTKRLTVPQVLAHAWTRQETPRYLRQIYRQHMLPRPAAMSSLSSLVTQEELDGTNGDDGAPATNVWNSDIVRELKQRIGVNEEVVLDALTSPDENAVKVAYAICADQRAGYDLRPVGEQEVVEQLAAAGSAPPSQLPQLANADDVLDDDSEEESDTPNKQLEWRLPSTFAVISNPPSPYLEESPSSSRYPLTDTSVEPVERDRDRRRRKHRGDRVSRPKPQLWHFGIRSVSGPMEIMVELYKSLQSLGIEWREKRGPWIANAACCWGDDAPTPDGQDALQGASKDDLDIFTVELRWRKRDIVALMKLRLHNTGPGSFTVDFMWLGHYKASTLPNAPRFEREDSLSRPPSDSHLKIPRRRTSGYISLVTNAARQGPSPPLEPPLITPRPPVMNPMLFFECSCELIAELTGVGAEPQPQPPPLS